MANIQVAVINESTVLTDAQLQAVIPALQTQVSRDFAPVWGIDAELIFVPHGSQPPAHAWWLIILDNSDLASALGYHDLTDQGLPLGKVFAGSDIKMGYQWTVTASHELLELLADPYTSLAAFIQPDANTGILYAYEVADACEADNLGYSINGVLVSDFVFPTWFESFRQPGSVQFYFTITYRSPFNCFLVDTSAYSTWQVVQDGTSLLLRKDSLNMICARAWAVAESGAEPHAISGCGAK